MSGEAMSKIVEVLTPHLKAGGGGEPKGKVVLGTVKGEDALSAALVGPEGSLEAMVDAEVAGTAEDFQAAADDILQVGDVEMLYDLYPPAPGYSDLGWDIPIPD